MTGPGTCSLWNREKESAQPPGRVIIFNDHGFLNMRLEGEGHTVADLLAAWQPFSEDVSLEKQFAAGNHADCRACINNCCRTAYVGVDLPALKAMAREKGMSELDFARTYLDHELLKKGIPRLSGMPCPFLRNDGCCGHYQARGLICRFYLCVPIAGALEELIYSITLAGIAATRMYLAGTSGVACYESGGMTSFDLLFRAELDKMADHPGTRRFLAASGYEDVPLKLFMMN